MSGMVVNGNYRLFPDDIEYYSRTHNIKELHKLYLKAAPEFLADKSGGSLINAANGAAFHLVELAFAHGASMGCEQSGIPECPKVLGIEVPRKVYVYQNKNDLKNAGSDGVNGTTYEIKSGQPLKREVDILLGTIITGEQWYEVKSWKAKSNTDRRITWPLKPWHWAKKVTNGVTTSEDVNSRSTSTGSNSHKQINLDRIAHKIGAYAPTLDERQDYDLSVDELNIDVTNVIWSFHKFKTKLSGGKININPTKGNIETEFLQPSKGEVKEHLTSKSNAKGYLKLGRAAALADVIGTELKDAIIEDAAEYASNSF